MRSQEPHRYVFSFRKDALDVGQVRRNIEAQDGISGLTLRDGQWNGCGTTVIEYVDDKTGMYHRFMIVPEMKIAAIFVGPDKDGSPLGALGDSAVVLR